MSIVLVGLPGSGKTRLGMRIAEAKGLPFVDLDREIEQSSGKTVPELFEIGEAHFRDLERDALRRALEGPDALISTGGGIVERPENRELLKEKLVVFLDIDVEEAIRRASRSHTRPLLADGVEERMRALSARRDAWYREVASVRVSLGAASKEQNTAKILKALEGFDGKGGSDAHC
ncbi:MAG: shikimate kinase [Actinomycetaceae bacterium]|nr:shikimate kinase [Actinomycetaceae bacterium]